MREVQGPSSQDLPRFFVSVHEDKCALHPRASQKLTAVATVSTPFPHFPAHKSRRAPCTTGACKTPSSQSDCGASEGRAVALHGACFVS